MNIVFLGSRPTSIFFYKQLIKYHNVKIVKTVEKNKWYANDINSPLNIKTINLNKINKTNCDLGISFNYNKKINFQILKKPKYGFINFHFSYKLRLRGRNIMFYSIMKNSKNAGYTIHWMDDKIDSGNIIKTKKILIGKNDTSENLYNNINKDLKLFLKKKFVKNLLYYATKKGYKPPKDYIYFSGTKFKKDLNEISDLKKRFKSKGNRIIRALTFKSYNKKLINQIQKTI